MRASLATPCRNCGHPNGVHVVPPSFLPRCLTCSCSTFEPDNCYWGHTDYCEHQDGPVMQDPARPPLGFDSNWTTKDSGLRAEFESGMVRDTQEGKARFDLLLPLGVPYSEQLLTRVAELLVRGAEKYGDRNWEKANSEEELERFKASAIRHLMQWATGEEDEDHAAACYYNLMGAEYVKRRLRDIQDRNSGVS